MYTLKTILTSKKPYRYSKFPVRSLFHPITLKTKDGREFIIDFEKCNLSYDLFDQQLIVFVELSDFISKKHFDLYEKNVYYDELTLEFLSESEIIDFCFSVYAYNQFGSKIDLNQGMITFQYEHNQKQIKYA